MHLTGLSALVAGCGGSGSSTPPPGPPPRNFLTIVIDDLNEWVGFLDANPQVRTPNMDRLAARSTVFRRNYCNAPLCNPSRSSFWSGLSLQHTGVYDNITPLRTAAPSAVVLPDHMRAHGYKTGLYGKVYHVYTSIPEPVPTTLPATNKVCSGYPTMQTEGLFDWGGMDVPASDMPDYKYAQEGIDFLDSTPTGTPFFLTVGFVRTHVAWYVPQQYLDMYPLDTIQLPDVPADDLDDVPPEGQALALAFNYQECITSQHLWASAVQAFLASITFVDEQVGRLLDALDASPHGANTVVVLLSDNGFHLGQKFHWHKEALWELTTRVPLVIRDRGQTVGANVDAAVSLLDYLPTVLELAGVPAPYAVDGTSLVPLMTTPTMAWDRPVLMTNAVLDAHGHATGVFDYAVRNNQYRYIQYHAGGREFYVEGADPGEFTNVAADPQYAATIAALQAYIPA